MCNTLFLCGCDPLHGTIILQIRIYAGNEITGILQYSGNTHFVGFSLPDDSVSSQDVRHSSDFWFYIVYVVSTIIIYTTCVTTIFFLVNKSKKIKKENTRFVDSLKSIEMKTSLSFKINEKSLSSQDLRSPIESFISKNPEVLKGTMVVIIVFIFLEIFTEFVMAIIWSVSVKEPAVTFTVFLAALVFYSPGIFSLYKISRKCYMYVTGYYATSHAREEARFDTLFKCFVWISSYFAYILLYSFFPAFILAFAYPTRVITVFAFVATFVLLSMLYLTTYIQKGATMKFCGAANTSDKRNRNCYYSHPSVKFLAWCVLTVTLLYFFLFIFLLLYSLVIGRASVATSAPLALLSLLPSVLISIAAWIMKSTLLQNNNEDNIIESGTIVVTDGPDTSDCNKVCSNNEQQNTGEIENDDVQVVEECTEM